MFKVKVVGDYVARSGIMDKEKIKKSYVIEGNIPTLIAPLSVVKNKLLGPALAAKYNDYVTFLTYHIIEITPLTPEAKTQMTKAEVSFMDRESLIKYVKDNNIGACSFEVEKGKTQTFPRLDPRYYPNLFKLREAVEQAKEDPIGYQKHFLIHEADLRLDLEVAQCNPELFNPQEESGLIASVGQIPPAPKASSPKALAKKTGDRLKGLAHDQARDGEIALLDEQPSDEVDDL